jgi:hypothetical protein
MLRSVQIGLPSPTQNRLSKGVLLAEHVEKERAAIANMEVSKIIRG